MRYCVRLPHVGPFASQESITKMALAAERLGYDAVSTHDHVNWGAGPDDCYHFYAGSAEASDERGNPTDFYEAFTTLSYLAGITKRVQLIPDSICLAWRPVALLARQALTLHQLAQGRFILCVGAGNVIGDFEVMDVPFDERLPISLEKLKVIRILVDQQSPISFEGKHVAFKNAHFNPQPRGLSLWYAGSGDVALRRAARYCEGWMPQATAEHLRKKIPELYEEAEKAGRGNIRFEVSVLPRVCIAATDEKARQLGRRTLDILSNPHKGEYMMHYSPAHRAISLEAHGSLIGSSKTLVERIQEFKDAGLTMFQLGFIGHSFQMLLEQMEIFAKEVMPKV